MWNKSIVCYIFITNFYFIFCRPSIEFSKMEPEELLKSPSYLQLVKMIQNMDSVEGRKLGYNANTVKKRVKRQGSGKFSEAANMTEMKTLRLFLQMFKNMWASSYVGGGHPLHPDVPKPVLLLFKQKVMDTFFPPEKKE